MKLDFSINSALFNKLGVIFLGITAYLLLFAENWSSAGRAGIAFLCAALCLMVANLDKIESLKASLSGIEAKTREAHKVVDEAKVIMAELHKLAEMTGTLFINLLSGGGRWDGDTPEEIENKRRQIVQGLESIGLDSAGIKRVLNADRKWVCIDYSIGILHQLKKLAASPQQQAAAQEMLERWNKETYRPSAEDLRQSLNTLNVTEQKILDLVEDYGHYEMTGEHRRLEVWINRHQWMF